MRVARKLMTISLIACSLALAVGGASPAGAAERRIVVQNAYYPKPGLEDEVYRTRLRASAVRARLGLVVGRVLRRLEGPAGGPHVVWEAEYPDPEARTRDVEALSGSAEFDAVAEHMGTLLTRFERTVWTVASIQRTRVCSGIVRLAMGVTARTPAMSQARRDASIPDGSDARGPSSVCHRTRCTSIAIPRSGCSIESRICTILAAAATPRPTSRMNGTVKVRWTRRSRVPVARAPRSTPARLPASPAAAMVG